MYKYVLIGYTINVGEFTPDDQPDKKIPYSNRDNTNANIKMGK